MSGSHSHSDSHDDLAHFTQASLDPGSWEVVVAEAPGRSATDLDGRPVTVRDTVLRAARRRA